MKKKLWKIVGEKDYQKYLSMYKQAEKKLEYIGKAINEAYDKGEYDKGEKLSGEFKEAEKNMMFYKSQVEKLKYIG